MRTYNQLKPSDYERGDTFVKTIITIQHTQSIHHTNGMVGSWTDWDLSEIGKLQAESIGKKLSEELQGRWICLRMKLT